jgi:hypothetical protein
VKLNKVKRSQGFAQHNVNLPWPFSVKSCRDQSSGRRCCTGTAEVRSPSWPPMLFNSFMYRHIRGSLHPTSDTFPPGSPLGHQGEKTNIHKLRLLYSKEWVDYHKILWINWVTKILFTHSLEIDLLVWNLHTIAYLRINPDGTEMRRHFVRHVVCITET